MELKEGIAHRRSIRSYNAQPVTKEEIQGVITVSAQAPSWKNTQTAHYIAVLDQELKNHIGNNCCMGFAGNANNISNAGALIVLTTVDGVSGYEKDGSFTTSKGTHWQSFDAGIACQTFCLAADDAGLGTVIMGIYDEKMVKEALAIPEGQSVSALIALGHYDKHPDARPRKTVEDLLSYR